MREDSISETDYGRPGSTGNNVKKKCTGKPITLQFIIEVEKTGSFNDFVNSLSEFIYQRYDNACFSYSVTNILDEKGRNTGYLRIRIYTVDDMDIKMFIDDWINNSMEDLKLYENIEIYNLKSRSLKKNHICPDCKGKGIIQKQKPREKCECKNGFIYSYKVCSACRGTGRQLLGLMSCKRCSGRGFCGYRYKCTLCKGTGYRPATAYEVPCPSCEGSGYVLTKLY